VDNQKVNNVISLS